MTEKPTKPKDIPHVLAPPPLIFGVPLIAGLVFHESFHAFDIPQHILSWPVRAFGGAAFVVLGATFIVLALLKFRRADTPPEPWEETTALVTGGIYRVTRNPMYLGMALIFLGIAVIAGCLFMLALLVPTLFVIDRYVIAREEAYLTRKFGDPYRALLASSRRWI